MGLLWVQQQIGEEAIEFNQDTGCNHHPNGGNDGSRGQILYEVAHAGLALQR